MRADLVSVALAFLDRWCKELTYVCALMAVSGAWKVSRHDVAPALAILPWREMPKEDCGPCKPLRSVRNFPFAQVYLPFSPIRQYSPRVPPKSMTVSECVRASNPPRANTGRQQMA